MALCSGLCRGIESTPIDKSGTISSGLAAITNAGQPGRLWLALYGARRTTAGGTLIKPKFRVGGAFGSGSTLASNAQRRKSVRRGQEREGYGKR